MHPSRRLTLLILRPLIGMIDTPLPLRYLAGCSKRTFLFPIPEVKVPKGDPNNVIRTVNENFRTLKFDGHQFESE